MSCGDVISTRAVDWSSILCVICAESYRGNLPNSQIFRHLIDLYKKYPRSMALIAEEKLALGGVIAFPTDTLYGIATPISSKVGYERIYQIKGRTKAKPVAVTFASKKQLFKCMPELSSESVVCDLLPGPVTLVIERPQFLPPHVNPGCEWIGVRVPNSLISKHSPNKSPSV